MPRPGEVVKKFEELYAKSPQEATDYFYKLSQDSNYIRRYRIAKDIRWSVPSAYGDIDISINLSKPKKDRRRSRLQNWQNRAVIRNACSARRMWAMRDASTTRRARTTASFR